MENRAALTERLNAIFAQRSTEDWCDTLERAGVANGPINTLDQVFQEPQVVARGLRIELDHPLAGKVPVVASPMRFSATPIEHRAAPPVLGQHTDEVLTDLLGMQPAELAALRSAGAL